MDPALARLWVSTYDDEDIVWGNRMDDRLHPGMNESRPYISRHLADGSTKIEPSPRYRTGALANGAHSQNQTVTFTVPHGVDRVRVGVLLCCGYTTRDVAFVTSMSLHRVTTCASFSCKVERHHCHFGRFTYWAAAHSSDVMAVAHMKHALLTGHTPFAQENNCDGRQHLSLRVYHAHGGVDAVCHDGHACHATALKRGFCVGNNGDDAACHACVCESHHSFRSGGLAPSVL